MWIIDWLPINTDNGQTITPYVTAILLTLVSSEIPGTDRPNSVKSVNRCIPVNNDLLLELRGAAPNDLGSYGRRATVVHTLPS